MFLSNREKGDRASRKRRKEPVKTTERRNHRSTVSPLFPNPRSFTHSRFFRMWSRRLDRAAETAEASTVAMVFVSVSFRRGQEERARARESFSFLSAVFVVSATGARRRFIFPPLFFPFVFCFDARCSTSASSSAIENAPSGFAPRRASRAAAASQQQCTGVVVDRSRSGNLGLLFADASWRRRRRRNACP